MAKHYLIHSILDDVPNALINLVLREWSSVELDDLVINSYSGHLPDQSRHLGRVIILYRNLTTRFVQYFLDKLGWKRAHVSYLQEVRFDSVCAELLHPVEYSSLCSAPSHDCDGG